MPKQTPERSTTWVHIEVSLDIDGHLCQYMIEGRPEGGPLSVQFHPEHGTSPEEFLTAIGLELSVRLVDCNLNVINDECPTDVPANLREPDVPRLRAVE